MELRIGKLKLENNLILGPMAGYTDKPFRMICEEFEPGLVVTEMVSSKGLYYSKKNNENFIDEFNKTIELMNTEGEKHPIAIQIFGSDTESMKFATDFICERNLADIIDINMGCPAPKVVKNGDGSRLLQDLKKVEEITKAVVKKSIVPVTVKIRKGWDNDNIVAIEASKAIENAGASAITIHGRTRSEYYSGKADWEIIKQAKESVTIPVIGNGDIRTPYEAKKRLEESGCDGLMISRGSLGKPWIFRQIQSFLETGTFEEITKKEKLKVILKHIELEVKDKGEERGIREMRKHICFYIKGENNASEIRNIINHLETQEQITKVLKEYFLNN